MELPKNKIEALGKSYFTPDFIKEFITLIELRAPNPDKYFFQVAQKGNKPTMEFGCKAEQILFDVTASTESVVTIVQKASSINSVMLVEGQSSTQLNIIMSSPPNLTYTTTIEDNRKELREYGAYLQLNLFGR